MVITLDRARKAPSLVNVTDDVLTALLATCCAAAERMTGRKFARETITETYDGDGTDALYLRRFPVTSITTVTLIDGSGVEDTYQGTDFRFNAETGELRWVPSVASLFPNGFQNIQVVYVAGFNPIPPDIETAIVQGAIHFLELETHGRPIVEEKLGEYTVRFEQRLSSVAGYDEWPPAARAILRRYAVRA